MLCVMVLGNWAWWFYLVVPLYAAYAVATTVGGLKGMMSGMGGPAAVDASPQGTGSKRQAKMEKRGGQRVQYSR